MDMHCFLFAEHIPEFGIEDMSIQVSVKQNLIVINL
jgi:hypothetical protein